MPLEVRIQYCNDDDGSIVFITVEKEGKELLKTPFYLSKKAEEQLPQLKDGFESLPQLLEMIYNSGKNQEEILFKTESIPI